MTGKGNSARLLRVPTNHCPSIDRMGLIELNSQRPPPNGLTVLIAAQRAGSGREKGREGGKKGRGRTDLAYGLVFCLSEQPVLDVVTEGRDLLKRAFH